MDNTLLKLSDVSFPLSIIEHHKTNLGPIFKAHIHKNHLQLFYFIKGDLTIYCNKRPYKISSPSIFLINNNQLHYAESNSTDLHYFVFRIDLKLLDSYHISCLNEKYIEPLYNNLIILKNSIASDYILSILKIMITEYNTKSSGYELALISNTFNLLNELLRNHIEISFSHKTSEMLSKKMKRFSKVFEYIEKNYNNAISLKTLSDIAFMSEGYFCRIFKQRTGRTPIDYINRFRIEKSVILLNQGICNITEAAMSVGFDDINYFCRVFKKYMNQSPTEYLKNDRRYFI